MAFPSSKPLEEETDVAEDSKLAIKLDVETFPRASYGSGYNYQASAPH